MTRRESIFFLAASLFSLDLSLFSCLLLISVIYQYSRFPILAFALPIPNRRLSSPLSLSPLPLPASDLPHGSGIPSAQPHLSQLARVLHGKIYSGG